VEQEDHMENDRNDTNATAPNNGIKESVKGLVDQGQEKMHALKDKVVDLQHKAKDKAADLSGKAKERGTAAFDRVTETIKAHPFAAVGIAFGIGYIVMRLVRR